MENDNDDNNKNYNKSDVKIKSMTISKLENELEKNDQIEINDKLRKNLFYFLCIEYCVSALDGGIIPNQNEHLQEDFEDEDNESRVGLFGSIEYIGRIIGSALMSILINKIDRRLLFSGACFFKCITSLIPIFYKRYYVNLIARLLSGIPQTLLSGYGTIWIDQFGKWKKRSMMLQILQFSAFLGIMFGYGLGILSNAILKKSSLNIYGWRLSFMIEGILLGVLGMIFLVYPKLYFSNSFYLNENEDNIGKEKSLKEIGKKSNPFKNLWEHLPKILCTKIFIFMSIGNTVGFFGMRIIQFYADKYMELVLLIEESRKFIYYIIICMTGPVLGIIICGIIITKMGGYLSKKGMVFILSLNIIGSVISIFITISLNIFLSLFSTWLYLFCLAAASPLHGGIIIASLPKDLKGDGYSINMFFLNALGSFPSSYVFALICDFIRNHYPEKGEMRYRDTMRITMLYNFVGLTLITIASILRFRIEGELGSSKNNKVIKEDEVKIEDKNEKMIETKEV